jgi:hypothetical protein
VLNKFNNLSAGIYLSSFDYTRISEMSYNISFLICWEDFSCCCYNILKNKQIN